MKLVTSREAAKQLGVHPNTLRRWANSGQIKAVKTQAGQRLYDVESFVGNQLEVEIEVGVGIIYARVSSRKQEDDLQRQIKFLQKKYPKHELVKNIGSRLNFKHKGLISILERANKGEIREVVPIETDLHALDMSLSTGLLRNMREQSWFATQLLAPLQKSSPKTYLPSLQY